MSGLRQRKRLQTLDRIATVAHELFERHGYTAVTMEQIAAEADVAKATLYKYFPVKEALLAHWIHAELADDMAGFVPTIDVHNGFAHGARALLHASAQWCEANRNYLPHYLRFRFLGIGAAAPEPPGISRSDIVDAFELLATNGQQCGELRVDMPARQLAELFHHLYLGAMLRWLMQPGLSLAEEFDAVVSLFAEGARAQPANTPPRKRSR
jgi:AcrR family transcriptional regulator